MANPEWLKIKQIFYLALEMNETEREEFLSKQDETIRHEVLELLKAHENSENFIAEPALIEFGLDENPLIGKKIGGYKLLEIIAAGGMGTVFLAEKEGLEKRFAVKLIKRGMDTDEVLRRFKLERQILGRLEHPNITPLLDGGMTADGLPFLVMEYVEGKTITRFCDEQNLDTKERLKLFRKVCTAVSYAHQNLIIHRDIKPSNILVTKDGVPKLLDFGIAKLLDTESAENTATTMQNRMFTPEYAAPEQLNGLPITTVSDVYSLGVVLYELLSGVRPFQTKSRNYLEIVEQILTKEPTRPSSVVLRQSETNENSTSEINEQRTNNNEQITTNDEQNSNPKSQNRNPKSLKGDIDNIILKSLRKEPERRYDSVEQFSEDIRRHLSGLPVSATADTSFYRFSKFFERNRTAVLAGVFVAILVFTVSAFAVRQSIVATRANQKSEARLREIRETAKSLLNETNDSLDKIPGNVSVQKALIEKSIALLDNLADEETNDETLLIELADAYIKLAFIQNISLRQTDKAGENIQKAETIYKRALEIQPNDVTLRSKLYQSQMRKVEYLTAKKDKVSIFKTIDEAIENKEKTVQIQPQNATLVGDLAAVFIGKARLHLAFNEKEESINSCKKGIEIIEKAIELQKNDPNELKRANEIPRFYFAKAELQKTLGDAEGAVQSFQTAIDLAEKTYSEGKEVKGNFYRIVTGNISIGEFYEAGENFDKAAEYYKKAKHWAKIGLKDKQITNQTDIYLDDCQLDVSIARIYQSQNDKRLAENSYLEAENNCRQKVSAESNMLEATTELLGEFTEIGDYYYENGKSEKAVGLMKFAAEKIEKILEKNESDLEAAFALAEVYEKLGDFQAEQQKREYYEKSFNIWKKYSENYNLLPAETEKMEAVKKKLQD
ncbi:MAG TPA: protein kinase [Pyrinomonadaceae bacterium]|nr:protein kinase [Pyrinomonadaceae bacterium]